MPWIIQHCQKAQSSFIHSIFISTRACIANIFNLSCFSLSVYIILQKFFGAKDAETPSNLAVFAAPRCIFLMARRESGLKVYFQVGAGRAAAVWPCRWPGWAGGVFREISFCRSGLDFFRVISRPLKITADTGENGGHGGWYRAGAGFLQKAPRPSFTLGEVHRLLCIRF